MRSGAASHGVLSLRPLRSLRLKHQSRVGSFSVERGNAFYTICTFYTAKICVGLRGGCFRAGAETGAASRQVHPHAIASVSRASGSRWLCGHILRRTQPLRDVLAQVGGCPQMTLLTGKNRYNYKQQSAKAEKGKAKL